MTLVAAATNLALIYLLVPHTDSSLRRFASAAGYFVLLIAVLLYAMTLA